MIGRVLLVALLALGVAGAVLLVREGFLDLLRKDGVEVDDPLKQLVGPGKVPFAPGERVQAVYLSELPWEWATTGWVALADDNLPKLDASFLGGVMTIGEKSYDKGLGVFPLSEIVYSLGGKYRQFRADVGLDGTVAPGKGSVIFKVFLDDALAYDSGVVRSGTAARRVEVSLIGVDKMKLVVEDADDGCCLDYANWANARLMPSTRQAVQTARQSRETLEADREERKRGRNRDWDEVATRSRKELADLPRVLGEKGARRSETIAAFDAERRRIVLANEKLAVTIGYGGPRHGLVDVLDLETRTLVAYDTTPSLTTRDHSTLVLSRHTEARGENGYRFQRIEDPALGSGMEVVADFHVPGADVVISPRLALFDGASYLTYQLELREVDEKVAVRSFSYFDRQKGGHFVLGEEAGYITDYSLIRRAEVRDDSILRQELIGLGKPLLLYDKGRSRGLVMAIIDEVADPAVFSVRLETGRVSGQLGFEHQVPEDVRATSIQLSPRLFFQVTPCASPEQATDHFRRVMAALYPPPPIPDWVKYQWGTWYAFGMDYDEETVRAQIDYIAENLADLGRWSILLDAGWYVAEGRPGSGWEVDLEKFPSGLRDLVDYAHSRDIKVVLYFSAPYLDDREREGNWLGLRGFIEQHPDWVIPLQSDDTGASYVYDFTNPELVEYMRKLISDFFLVYDVDGIKIDGLGQAEGELLSVEERDSFGDVNKIRMFTMEIYRLVYEEATRAKKDVYIESGWAIPNFANRFAHTFRYGDEFPDFEARYPHAGLVEHVDYAAIQKRLVGQRPNMGMVWGGPESQRTIRLWFEAALALGTQMTISTDLSRLSSRDLSALRSVLVHYNAFQGETHFVGMPFPESFATTSNGITYLGGLNRDREAKETVFNLSDYGLDWEREYLVYDVSSNSFSRVRGSFPATLEGSSFRLFLLRDTPGVMWTNSSYQAESAPGSLMVRVLGPRSITGFIQIYLPTSPSRVRLDGKELARSPRLIAGNSYWYDEGTGVLRLRYRHDRPHTIEVEY